MVEQELKCDRCKKFVHVSQLRYQLSGGSRILVCNKCLSLKNEEKRSIEDEIFGRTATKKKPEIVEEDVRIESPETNVKTFKYQCISCRFSFRRPAHKQVLKCPNCGDSKMLKYSTINADTLLKISDDERFDF